MSEFSDSYHLRTSDPAIVEDLIRRSGRYGLVLPTTGPYIPFQVEEPSEQIVEHNRHILVHYSFGEDHGCWISVYDGSRPIATLSYTEPAALRPDHRPTSTNADNLAPALAVLQQRGIIDERCTIRLHELAQPVHVPTVGPQVAAALGLEHVSWLSGRHLTRDPLEDLLQRFPGARVVNEERRGLIPPSPPLMERPVPQVALTAEQEAMIQRHYRYWTQFGDWDDEAQHGFWMYEHYGSVLPQEYQYLPDRLMNLYTDSAHAQETVATLRAIIGLADEDDWVPYLRGY